MENSISCYWNLGNDCFKNVTLSEIVSFLLSRGKTTQFTSCTPLLINDE